MAPAPPPQGRQLSIWWFAVPLGLIAASGGLTASLLLRRRHASPAPGDRVEALGSADFEEAREAFETLSALGRGDARGMEILLKALEDDRPTPFLGVRRSAQGLLPVASSGGSPARVRQVAAFLLEQALGRPPGVIKPTAKDWQAHWQAQRKGSAPSRAKKPGR